jgi:hypothetical protein
MHNKQIESIAQALHSVAQAAQAPSAGPLSGLRMHNDIAYTLSPEAIALYGEQVRALLEYDRFSQHFSEAHLRKKLNAVLAKAIQNPLTDVKGALRELVEECGSAQPVVSVYIRLDGVRFDLPQPLEIGSVTARSGDDELFADLDAKKRTVLKGVIGNRRNKAAASRKTGQSYRKAFRGGCVLEYAVDAEPARAVERAQEECRFVVDMLRLLSKFRYPMGEDVRIGLLGERPRMEVYSFATSTEAFHPDVHRRGSVFTFELNHAALEKLKDLGLLDLARDLAANTASKVDILLKRAIHWLSVGLAQDEAESSLISFIVALECFFKPEQGSSITGAVAEGVAFALGADSDGRRHLAKRVREFYKKRSKLAHGGSVVFSETDRVLLVRLVIGVICEFLERRRELKSTDDIVDWLEGLKYA